MGLDMYLDANRYVSQYNDEGQELSKAVKAAMGLDIELPLSGIKIGAAYWRKANQIHKWFVDNVQDGVDECQHTDVSREQLLELKALCERVKQEPDQAEALLPVQSGFFFGGTDYGDWYFDDINETIQQLEKALALPKEFDFTYHASW